MLALPGHAQAHEHAVEHAHGGLYAGGHGLSVHGEGLGQPGHLGLLPQLHLLPPRRERLQGAEEIKRKRWEAGRLVGQPVSSMGQLDSSCSGLRVLMPCRAVLPLVDIGSSKTLLLASSTHLQQPLPLLAALAARQGADASGAVTAHRAVRRVAARHPGLAQAVVADAQQHRSAGLVHAHAAQLHEPADRGRAGASGMGVGFREGGSLELMCRKS